MASYNDLLSNGKYIDQYAGIPLDQIRNTAETLSARHYQNLASASQLQILQNQLKSQALPGAQAYFDDQIGGVQKALEDMAKNGGENSTARINALATKFQSDPNMLNAMQRSKEFAAQTAMIDEIRAQGKTPLYDEQRRENMMNASPIDSSYKTPYQMGVEPLLNAFDERKAIWSELNPDSWESPLKAALNTTSNELIGKAFNNEDPDLPMFFESITSGGISGKKIKDQLENAWSAYKNTGSYKQQTGIIGKSEKEVKQEFYQQGLTKVYSNLKRDYHQTPAWAGRAGGAEGAPPTQLKVASPATVRQQDKADWDVSGILGDATLLAASSGYGQEGMIKEQGEITDELLKGREARRIEAENKQIPALKAAMEMYGILPDKPINIGTGPGQKQQTLGNMSETEFRQFLHTPKGSEALKQYTADHQSLRAENTYRAVPLSDKEAEPTEQFLKRTKHERLVLDESGKGVTIMDEHGKPRNKDMAMLSQAIDDGTVVYLGLGDPRHPMAKQIGESSFIRPILVEVPDPDKKGASKRFYMSNIDAISPKDNNENVLWERGTSKPGQPVDVGSGYSVKSLYTPQAREHYYPRFSVQQIEGQNQYIKPESFINSKDALIITTPSGVEMAFGNYSAAADYLAKQGIVLPLK